MKRLLPLALLILAPGALAQSIRINQLSSARAYGMGGAFRATGLGADSVLGNPATLGLLKAYQLDLTGNYDFPAQNGYGAVTMRDSSTSEVAAGMSYHFLALGTPAARSFAHLGTVALSIPIADVIVLGVGGRYLNEWGARISNAATMDAGVAVRPFGGLVIALGAHNLIYTANPELIRYYSGAIAYLGSTFTIALDVRSTLRGDSGKPTLNVGGEYVIGQMFFIRAGYSHSFIENTNFASGGLGIFGSGAGVDVSYRHEFGGFESRVVALTIRIQM